MRTHHPNQFFTMLTTTVVLAGGMLLSSVALAGNYEVCIDIQVQHNDSEIAAPTSVEEDYWLTDTQETFPARGFYVQVYNAGDILESGYSDPNTGCFAFVLPGTSSYANCQVRVHSVAKQGTNYVRVHDGGASTASSSPGSNLPSIVFDDRTFHPDQTVDDIVVPLSGDWNVLATASFALWRVSTGLDDTTISIGFADDGSSANYGNSASYIDQGDYLLRINNNPNSSPNNWDGRWMKFEVAHEMGHAVARLNYGQDGVEDDYEDGYVHTGTTSFGCDNDPGYGLRSVEYDSMGFKEAFAHLYAARVFNDRDSDGSLTIMGSTISLEAYDSGTNSTGGHLRNHCDDTPDHGVSTIEEWTRFLWDIYTIPSATCSPSTIGLDDMYDIYSATRAMNPTAVDAWHTDIMDAVDANGTLSSCEKTQAGSFANWNAIGGVSHVY